MYEEKLSLEGLLVFAIMCALVILVDFVVILRERHITRYQDKIPFQQVTSIRLT